MYDYTYYDYGYGYETPDVSSGLAVIGAGFLIIWMIAMAIGIFTIVCNWKVFKKAGKPGWASIVPIYNTIVMLEIAELPLWYIALFFIPFANIYAMFKIYIEIAHKFGKSTGFGVGMVFFTPIFMAILAFDKNANYIGVQPQPVQPQYQQPVQPEPIQPTVEPVQQPAQSQPNPTISPAFCTNCGSALIPNSKFCTNCGKQL